MKGRTGCRRCWARTGGTGGGCAVSSPGLAAAWLPCDPDDVIGPGAAIGETAQLKHGDATACVAPQHAGITGQVENCVTATAAAATGTSHADADADDADFRIPLGDAPVPAYPGQPRPRQPGLIMLSVAETARLARLAADWAAGLLTPAQLAFRLRWPAPRRRHQAAARWHHHAARWLRQPEPRRPDGGDSM